MQWSVSGHQDIHHGWPHIWDEVFLVTTATSRIIGSPTRLISARFPEFESVFGISPATWIHRAPESNFNLQCYSDKSSSRLPGTGRSGAGGHGASDLLVHETLRCWRSSLSLTINSVAPLISTMDPIDNRKHGKHSAEISVQHLTSDKPPSLSPSRRILQSIKNLLLRSGIETHGWVICFGTFTYI
jgi:hypothetical protein